MNRLPHYDFFRLVSVTTLLAFNEFLSCNDCFLLQVNAILIDQSLKHQQLVLVALFQFSHPVSTYVHTVGIWHNNNGKLLSGKKNYFC